MDDHTIRKRRPVPDWEMPPKPFKRKRSRNDTLSAHRPQQDSATDQSESEDDIFSRFNLDNVDLADGDEELLSDEADTDGQEQVSGLSDEVDLSEGTASDSEPPLSEDDEMQDDAALAQLHTAIDNMAADARGQPLKKKRKLASEAPPESEFAPVNDGTRKLTAQDLLKALSSNPVQAAQLKKSLKVLSGTASSKSKGTLPTPLHGRSQAKLKRKAAKEKLHVAVDKWNDTVSQMKGIGSKESQLGVHRISLPLKAETKEHGITAAELGSTFKPLNSLEQELTSLLSQSQVESQKSQLQAEAEALTTQNLSLEEQKARTAMLRQQRELLFRAERKAKRVAKIKSKTYRKIARKARAHAQAAEGNPELTLEELEELDEIDGGFRMAEKRQEMEMARARERATLKHATGSHAGRWAKEGRLLAGLDQDDVKENERIRKTKEDELRRKIIDEDSDEGSSYDDNDDEGNLTDTKGDVQQAAFDELASYDAAEQAKAAAQSKSSGLLGMSFMQKAMARKDAQAEELAQAFRDELQGNNSNSDDEDMLDGLKARIGRKMYAPQAETAFTEKKKTVKEAVPVRSNILTTQEVIPSIDVEEAPTNPWLASTSAITKKARKNASNKITDAEKTVLKATKAKKKSDAGRQAEREEGTVVIDVNSILGQKLSKNAQKKLQRAKHFADDAELESDLDSESAAEPGLDGRPMAFQQRDLVARAFANDNVVAEFEEEKRRIIEEDALQDIDVTIPGWGSWAGKGVKNKSKQRKFISRKPGVEATDRKDAKLAHVIINEKRDKKAVKYLLKDLPFPYTSAAQHEQHISQPMGPEFVTGSISRNLTRPEVLLQAGSLVRPISMSAT